MCKFVDSAVHVFILLHCSSHALSLKMIRGGYGLEISALAPSIPLLASQFNSNLQSQVIGAGSRGARWGGAPLATITEN